MAFPLHRLPFLAFAEVVKHLEFFEKLALILMSRKTRHCMNLISKPTISIQIDDYILSNMVSIHLAQDYHNIVQFDIVYSSPAPKSSSWIHFKNVRTQALICWKPIELMTVFYPDRQEGFEEVLHFLKTSFNIEFVEFGLSCEDPAKSSQLVETVKNEELRIQHLWWRANKEFEDSACKKMIQAAAHAKTVAFYSEVKKGFRFDGFSEYALESLKIVKAHWITSDNLRELVNCREVRLNLTNLTSNDFNILLQYIMKNDVKIRQWEIHTNQELDATSILDGLESRKQTEETWILQKPDGVAYRIELLVRLKKLRICRDE